MTSPDRILAQFPLSDATGYSATEIVVAVEQGKPVTYERTRSAVSRRVGGTFTWSSIDVALSVAMSNAGWGHRNARLAAAADRDVKARIAAAEEVSA